VPSSTFTAIGIRGAIGAIGDTGTITTGARAFFWYAQEPATLLEKRV
jgi:hypothetical protein